MRHEAVEGPRLGGHTILRHVWLDEATVRQRIAETVASSRPPAMISTFDDLAIAQRSISRVLRINKAQIQQWAQSAGRRNLVLEMDAGRDVGFGDHAIDRESRQTVAGENHPSQGRVQRNAVFHSHLLPDLVAMADGFFEISQMIGGYLHQDMDLYADTVREAILNYCGDIAESERVQVEAEMDEFLARYHNRAEDEFARRWGRDFTPVEIGLSVAAFFAMVKDLLSGADLSAARD
nr:contact-dependent growth inhibition system immunity protein [Jiella flava]